MQSTGKKRKNDEIQHVNTEGTKAALSKHLPIIMCIGLVEYTDEEYTLKMETMKHPETLVRFRDTMRMRALRERCDGNVHRGDLHSQVVTQLSALSYSEWLNGNTAIMRKAQRHLTI